MNKKYAFKTFLVLGGSPGLLVMGVGSCSEGFWFESQHRKLDGHFSHILVLRDENKQKRGRGWSIKNFSHSNFDDILLTTNNLTYRNVSHSIGIPG